MNTLEFFWAPDLLLWGRWNALFALGFIALVWFSALYNPSASNKRFTHA
jgi:hypothetical protein